MWVVFMDADGSCWTVPNPEVRIAANWSMGRRPLRAGRLNGPGEQAAATASATARANGMTLE
jgi:hypothetical protein